MACRALLSALVLASALLAPALAGPDEAPNTNQDTGTRQDAAAVAKPVLPNEIAAPAAAPRAAQIEPVMVEPVKRVAPKTLEIKTPEKKSAIVVTIEKDPSLSEKKPTADNKKSCGAGQKRSGTVCTKIAANRPNGKKRR